MIKVLLLDIDGIVITTSGGMFSERLSKEHSVPMESILDFIHSDFQLCKVGKADLREKLLERLEDWNWEGTVDELINFWFEGETIVNEDVIKFITNLRKNGIRCYLASDNEKYRSEYILNNIGIKKYFDGVFMSYEVGYTKHEEGFFEKVLNVLDDVNPSNIVFWDDKEENLRYAKKLGIKTHHFKNVEDFIRTTMSRLPF